MPRRSRIPQAGSLEENFFSAIFIGETNALFQKISITVASIPSLVIPDNVSIMRVFADVNCYLAYGETPVADADKLLLPGGIIEYFGVDPGKKIAVIRAGTKNGTLYVAFGDFDK